MCTHVLKLTTLAVVALMTTGPAGLAAATQYHKPAAQKCMDEQNCPSQQQPASKEQAAASTKPMHARLDWKFDPTKEQRSRHHSDRFRFAYGGYWYPEPYWLRGLKVGHRIGCDDGRAILRDRGFYQIKPVECRGGTYTYFGHRHGEDFRVLLSSRSGRIVNVKPI
jgi:hypothetical protein